MTRFPAAVTGRAVAIGATLWTLSIVFFAAQAIAQAASARPYSPVTNLISDLGNTACGPTICSPLHGLVDATFVVVGLCHGLGALATYRAWPRQWLSAVGVWLLVIAGAGLVVAGLVPENVSPEAHARGALLGLVCLNLSMLALGWSIVSARRGLATLTFGAGIVGLVGLGLFLSGAGGLPPGATERLADYPGAAMVVVLGAYLLVATTRARRRPGGMMPE
jgi:hypothetical membrane protein